MFEYPLIRFDNKIWLEKLQNGEFYTRTSFYYQSIEENDLARSDPFDGSIPYPNKDEIMKKLTGKETRNGRIVLPDRFIKCFYCCDSEDFEEVNNRIIKLKLSKESMETIKEFNTDSAMIIFNPSEFINQIKKECYKMKKRLWYGHVKYCEETQYSELLLSFPMDDSEINKLPFYKSKKFAHQKEYRFSIEHSIGVKFGNKIWTEIPSSINDLSFTLNIGSLENACIISVDNLLEKGLLFDKQNNHWFVCEE